MLIGKMDRRVDLKCRELSQDDYGEQVETFKHLATVWAHKMHMTGKEFMAAGSKLESTLRSYRIRWRTDLKVTDRLEHDGLVFEIHDMRELGRKAGWELQCRAITPESTIS